MGIIVKIKALFMTLAVFFGYISGYQLPKVSARYTKEEIAAYTATTKDACGEGMIIAIGGGFDTEALFRPLIEKSFAHVQKEQPKLLFIPTASMDVLDGPETDVLPWFENAGCESEVLYVSRATADEVREKFAWADIVYETGGNLRFLTENWREKSVYDAAKDALARGAVLMGCSSGAMCWAERGWDDCGEPVQRVIDEFPFYGEDTAYEFFNCAGLLPFCLCPHFDNVAWRMFAYEAVKLDIPSLCIENGAAVIFENGTYQVISDSATPRRTAYLFYPDKNVVMLDLRKNADFITVADGEQRSK